MRGGVDMSFWVWVGVAIVVVLLVLVFVRDRFEARHRGGTGTPTPSVAMTDTMANPGEAAADGGDTSPLSDAPTPFDKPSLGCRLNIHHLWQWEYPPEGKKFGRCQKCGKINDNWIGKFDWPERSYPSSSILDMYVDDDDSGGGESGASDSDGDGSGSGS